MSKRAFWRSEGPLGVQNDTDFCFTPKIPQTQILSNSNAYPIKNKILNNFTTADEGQSNCVRFFLIRHAMYVETRRPIGRCRMTKGCWLNGFLKAEVLV